MGALTILQSILQLLFAPANGFTQGVQPIVSYSYGARVFDRVKSAAKRLKMCIRDRSMPALDINDPHDESGHGPGVVRAFSPEGLSCGQLRGCIDPHLIKATFFIFTQLFSAI